jgi:hypothetical protein
MSLQNEKMDEKVLAAVKAGNDKFSAIHNSICRSGDPAPFREVDRSLQRLRRTGKIKYEGGRWKNTPQETPMAEIKNDAPAKTLTVEDKVAEMVSYHKPDEKGIAAITAVREATAKLILTIVQNCPPSPDRSAAIRKAREAMMTANASIVVPQVQF